MKIIGNSDSHFVIGKKHIKQNAPCQDHALSGQLGESLFAVIADGCSSGRHTDIGARIITCAAIAAIKECLALTNDMTQLPKLIHQALIVNAQKTAVAMGLDNQDLLATCVYAVVTPQGGFIHILGDGHAVIKFTNGSLKIVNTEWQNNTPYYPADNRKALFIAEHSKFEQGEKSLELEAINMDVNGLESTKSNISIIDAVEGVVIPLSEDDLSAVEVIALMSDGIGQFKKDGAFLPVISVVTPLTAFKTWAGEFVKRRLSRGLLDFGSDGTFPDDDVSIAAIHLESKTESI